MTVMLEPGTRTAPKMWRQSEPLYLTGCVSTGIGGDEIRRAARTQNRLGVLAQPGNAVHRQAPHFANWAVDNGAYGVARQAFLGKREPWNDDDTADYLRYLAKVRDEVEIKNCLFATAPDVLEFRLVDGKPVPFGDAEATWERSRQIFPAIRALGFPAALVAQDGMSTEKPFNQKDFDKFDVLFLGGSDTFKLGGEGAQVANNAWRFGKWVHMGRVSSLKRMKYLQSIGCDSADGTYLGFGPAKNLPNVLDWLAQTERPRTAPTATPIAA